MNYIVKCTSCRQKGIVELKEGEKMEGKECPVCNRKEYLEIEIKVEDALPDLELITKALSLK